MHRTSAYMLAKTNQNHSLITRLKVILQTNCTAEVVPNKWTWNYKVNLERMLI
jgi:hypothetical protein